MSSFANVNLDDPRQDVHKSRLVRPTLNRFRVAERLASQFKLGGQVLEIGGGAGEFSQRLRDLGFAVTFVDLSPSNVARAEQLGFPAHQIDLNHGLPGIPDASYNGVVMLEIIEHVVAAENLLSEVYRVLRPGGYLILSTPNFAYWINRLQILAGRLSHDEGYHFRFFTPSILESRLRKAGLRIVKTHHTTPALGLNLVRRLAGHSQRIHLRVPRLIAPLLAHTLVVCAQKPESEIHKP